MSFVGLFGEPVESSRISRCAVSQFIYELQEVTSSNGVSTDAKFDYKEQSKINKYFEVLSYLWETYITHYHILAGEANMNKFK